MPPRPGPLFQPCPQDSMRMRHHVHCTGQSDHVDASCQPTALVPLMNVYDSIRTAQVSIHGKAEFMQRERRALAE